LLSYPSSTLAIVQPPHRARVWKEVGFILAGTSEYNFNLERLYTDIRLVADPATSVRTE
jgi:tetratricopeptide (TPR) repeat protein